LERDINYFDLQDIIEEHQRSFSKLEIEIISSAM
jgi:hypothetical protein